MNCPSCGKENKEGAPVCVKCGTKLIIPWQPTWRWHIKVLIIIYAVLGVLYLALRIFLK